MDGKGSLMASFVLPIISGLAGLFGGAPKTTTQTQNLSGSSTTGSDSASQGSSTQNPILSQLQQLISSIAGGTALNNLQNGTDLRGYTAQGFQGINAANRNNQQITQNILQQRGLQNSPYAAYASMLPEQQRLSQQTQFQEGIPLIQHQLQQGDIQSLLSTFGPYGSQTNQQQNGSTSGTNQFNQSGTGTSTSPNEMLPGLFSGFGAGLAATGFGMPKLGGG